MEEAIPHFSIFQTPQGVFFFLFLGGFKINY